MLVSGDFSIFQTHIVHFSWYTASKFFKNILVFFSPWDNCTFWIGRLSNRQSTCWATLIIVSKMHTTHSKFEVHCHFIQQLNPPKKKRTPDFDALETWKEQFRKENIKREPFRLRWLCLAWYIDRRDHRAHTITRWFRWILRYFSYIKT